MLGRTHVFMGSKVIEISFRFELGRVAHRRSACGFYLIEPKCCRGFDCAGANVAAIAPMSGLPEADMIMVMAMIVRLHAACRARRAGFDHVSCRS